MAPEAREVHLLNKPAGVVSTAADTHGRRTVVEYVASPRRLYPVGRLDVDTTGLILLTNDGALADRLTHPRYGVQKVYRASVRPADISEDAVSRLRAGVTLDDGRTSPAEVSVLGSGPDGDHDRRGTQATGAAHVRGRRLQGQLARAGARSAR